MSGDKGQKIEQEGVVTRFAPSPTGFLHLGHAFSALCCQRIAGEGKFLLRYEDIDFTRVREEYYEAILEDLGWLGVHFSGEVPMRQLDRLDVYAEYLDDLRQRGLVYPCFCTRKELRADADLNAPQEGEEPAVYSGKCRGLSDEEREEKIQAGLPYAWRLDVALAMQEVGPLHFQEAGSGEVLVNPNLLGDVVVARKDIATSYHLAVVIDDAKQGVTDVVRGEDLRSSTHVHRILQALWGFSAPRYHHHRLILDEKGKRLAKRHDALSLRALREAGVTREEIYARVNLPAFTPLS